MTIRDKHYRKIKFDTAGFLLILWTDCTSVNPEFSEDQIRETFWIGPASRLGDAVGSTPARRAGDAGSIPGSGGNFFF